MYTVS